MHAGVASKTVGSLVGEQAVPRTTTATLTEIQSALEAAGIEFIGTPDDGPRIRIRPAREAPRRSRLPTPPNWGGQTLDNAGNYPTNCAGRFHMFSSHWTMHCSMHVEF
jgi:hypothetical protein